MSYNWEVDRGERWTVLIDLEIGKTTLIGETPVQFQLDPYYFVEQPDAFGPDCFVGIELGPRPPWARGSLH